MAVCQRVDLVFDNPIFRASHQDHVKIQSRFDSKKCWVETVAQIGKKIHLYFYLINLSTYLPTYLSFYLGMYQNQSCYIWGDEHPFTSYLGFTRVPRFWLIPICLSIHYAKVAKILLRNLRSTTYRSWPTCMNQRHPGCGETHRAGIYGV